MNERRAKQQRRRLLIMAGKAFRPKRIPKRAASPELIGWQNTTREEYDEARRERK
jgi:hypothetical protein